MITATATNNTNKIIKTFVVVKNVESDESAGFAGALLAGFAGALLAGFADVLSAEALFAGVLFAGVLDAGMLYPHVKLTASIIEPWRPLYPLTRLSDGHVAKNSFPPVPP
jgi:hypothetical protein